MKCARTSSVKRIIMKIKLKKSTLKRNLKRNNAKQMNESEYSLFILKYSKQEKQWLNVIFFKLVFVTVRLGLCYCLQYNKLKCLKFKDNFLMCSNSLHFNTGCTIWHWVYRVLESLYGYIFPIMF